MTEKNKEHGNARPPTGKTEDRETTKSGIDNTALEIINPLTMTFEDEEVIYVEKDGERYYPVPAVGALFGYSRNYALQVFQRNLEYLEGKCYSCKMQELSNTVFVPCLKSKGVLVYTSRANLKRLPKERREKVLKVVDFMAESADLRLKGELISRNEVEGLFNAVTFKDNSRDVQRENGLRRAQFVKKCNELHPNSPNTVKRLHSLSHNDHFLLVGIRSCQKTRS